MMTKQEHIDYWIQTSEDDWITVNSLLNNGRFLHCLFFAVSIVLLLAISCKDSNPAAPVYQNRILNCLLKDTTSDGNVGTDVSSFPANSAVFMEMEFEKIMTDTLAVFKIYNDSFSKYAPVYEALATVSPSHYCKSYVVNLKSPGNYRIDFRFNNRDSVPYATKNLIIY